MDCCTYAVEFYGDQIIPSTTIIQPQAPVLALLGDVGLAFTAELRSFLHQQAEQFEHVLYLAGNHEFYNNRNGSYHTVLEQLAWLRQVCDEKPNLHFLEKTVVQIGAVRILGTTLWSHVPDSMSQKAEQYLNDYHLSYVEETPPSTSMRKMLTRDTNQWHQESVSWLEHEIAQAQQPVVVLTHHTPSLVGTSNPRYDGNELSHCFSTNLTNLLEDPVVRVWACGHTHYNFHINLSDNNNTKTTSTILLSNQRGYPGVAKQLKSYDAKGYVIDLASLELPRHS